ncbi:MAG: penicillin-binding protein 2 [Candidatus Auribacterota bacterium]|jgi:penicillin-binding protein 2|nr:penicillin-binding protein 2 [Candidatus Auribacterota bacterium]
MVRIRRAEEHFIGQFEGRIKFLVLGIFFCFAFLWFSCWRIQILHGEWFVELARNNRVRKIIIPAPRGNIYDRKGVILADNRPSFDVEVVIEDIPNEKKNSIVHKLASILDISEETILRKIQISRHVPYVPEKIVRDINMQQLNMIMENREYFPGISIQPTPVRDYRFGPHASHVLGYIGKLSSEEYKRLKSESYFMQDYIGKMGIEKELERYLKGEHGGMQVQVDNRGYTDDILGVKEPVPGSNVYLTIDHHLQMYIESLMMDHTGAVVVMDVRNGDVLAMASFPEYDPNLFVKPTSTEIIRELFQSKHKYLINKAIREVYPPGSTFKMLVALSAMESSGLTIADKYYCNGSFVMGKFTWKCWHKAGHGWVNVIEAIRYSCNVFFYNLGHKMIGVHQIHNWADQFGFGKKTGILLDAESAGVNPDKTWKKYTLNLPWYPGDTINLSIGQGFMLVTPLQLVSFMVAIANGGELLQPRLVERVVSNTGEVLQSFPRVVLNKIKMSENTYKVIAEGMKEVVQHDYGTGKKAAVKDIPVSGKTGTIQMGTPQNRIHHAWFCGFAPSDNPEIAFIILVEQGTSGGTYAAPIAGKIVDFYFKNKPQVLANQQDME